MENEGKKYQAQWDTAHAQSTYLHGKVFLEENHIRNQEAQLTNLKLQAENQALEMSQYAPSDHQTHYGDTGGSAA